MKKFLLAVLAVILAVTPVLSGCGEKVTNIDPNKKQVYISVFNGGFGYQWLEETVAEFNAEPENQATQFILSEPNKDSYSQILSMLKANSTPNDIFFTNFPDTKSFSVLGLVEDLSDVYEMDAELALNAGSVQAAMAADENNSIGNKIVDADTFRQAYSGNGENADKLYGIPFTDAIQGFIYDHDLFVQRDLLRKDASGNVTLGKDGKSGTYDDGLPVNMQEWNDMLADIKSFSIYPMMWNGSTSDYLVSLTETMWAQYDGPENYLLSSTYSGTYNPPSGAADVKIEPATGYLTYEMEGKRAALQFTYDTLLGADDLGYINPNSYKLGFSYKDAQTNFILGYKKNDMNPWTAMLYDGVWWENERRTLFDDLAADGEKDQAFGKRDFRFMPLPNMDGGLGIDGENGGSVFTVSESGSVMVKKQTDPVKLDAIKRFIAYTCSDKVLKRFTTMTGGFRPFEYDLTNDEFNSLTKFGQNAWTIYTDRENVYISRPSLTRYISPLNYLITTPAKKWTAHVAGNTYYEAYLALKAADNAGVADPVETVFAATKEAHNAGHWNELVGQLG